MDSIETPVHTNPVDQVHWMENVNTEDVRVILGGNISPSATMDPSEHSMIPGNVNNITPPSTQGSRTSLGSIMLLCAVVGMIIYLVIELYKTKRMVKELQSAHMSNEDVTYLTQSLPRHVMNEVTSTMTKYKQHSDSVLQEHLQMYQNNVNSVTRENIHMPTPADKTQPPILTIVSDIMQPRTSVEIEEIVNEEEEDNSKTQYVNTSNDEETKINPASRQLSGDIVPSIYPSNVVVHPEARDDQDNETQTSKDIIHDKDTSGKDDNEGVMKDIKEHQTTPQVKIPNTKTRIRRATRSKKDDDGDSI